MSLPSSHSAVDMTRWTFTVRPEHKAAIESYLNDMGLDVFVNDEGLVHVSWEECDRDMDEVVAELWEMNGEPFEVSQEEFHRVNIFLLHRDDSDDARSAA